MCQCHCATIIRVRIITSRWPDFRDHLQILRATLRLLQVRVNIIFLATIENLLTRFSKCRATVASSEGADRRFTETRGSHAGMLS